MMKIVMKQFLMQCSHHHHVFGTFLSVEFSFGRCLQNAAHDVGDLMKLETSFTDVAASRVDTSSHPTTTLTFESERAAAVASSHRHQSISGSGGVSEQLLGGKPAEFQGKLVDYLTAQQASSLACLSQNVVPTAVPSMVICSCVM